MAFIAITILLVGGILVLALLWYKERQQATLTDKVVNFGLDVLKQKL